MGRTSENAPNALGVCNTVITEAASVHDGQANRRDQERTAQCGGDDPADHEPRTPRRGDLCGGSRGGHHRRRRNRWQHAELLAGDRHRNQMRGQPHAGHRPERAGQIAVGDDQLDERDRRDDGKRHQGWPECNSDQITGLWGTYGRRYLQSWPVRQGEVVSSARSGLRRAGTRTLRRLGCRRLRSGRARSSRTRSGRKAGDAGRRGRRVGVGPGEMLWPESAGRVVAVRRRVAGR